MFITKNVNNIAKCISIKLYSTSYSILFMIYEQTSIKMFDYLHYLSIQYSFYFFMKTFCFILLFNFYIISFWYNMSDGRNETTL